MTKKKKIISLFCLKQSLALAHADIDDGKVVFVLNESEFRLL